MLTLKIKKENRPHCKEVNRFVKKGRARMRRTNKKRNYSVPYLVKENIR
jgi:hypothetical protein